MKIFLTVFKIRMDRQELRFLLSAYSLMLLYISMKFYENVLTGFQVIEWTHNDLRGGGQDIIMRGKEEGEGKSK